MAQVFDTVEWRNCQVQPLDIYTEAGPSAGSSRRPKLYEGKESDAIFPYWNLWVPVEEANELSTLTTNIESNVATVDRGVHHRGPRPEQRR